MVRSATVKARGFNCANCGAAVGLRALTHTAAVACTSCGALLDARDRTLIVLQQAALRQTVVPTIPLGTRGTWHGHPYEVIGFQRRGVEVDDELYTWDEYVLFNPYQGFRYLTEYDGHWNDVRTVRDLPALAPDGRGTTATWNGRRFRRFQAADATCRFVLGEFPWRVTVGEQVRTTDYIDPPFLLSRETTPDEVTWSLGEYVEGDRVWEAFRLPGAPPAASGTYANQPSPAAGIAARAWKVFGGLLLLLLLAFAGRGLTAAREELFRKTYTFANAPAAEQSFVTEPFQVPEPSTLELQLALEQTNAWLWLDLALINMDTGEAFNVAREVSHYSGTDADGAWSEGARLERVRLPAVPAGEYYLRVEPESGGELRSVGYSLAVIRDVPQVLPYGVALGVLLLIPVLATWREQAFERARWGESDDAGGD